MTDIHESVARLEEHIIDMRRRLHRHPELGCEETETTAFIVSELREIGIPVITFDDITGCIAVIEGGKPGKTVMLRADIDALPITEQTGLPFASETPGVMHACGHDCHTAMLLGAARVLWEMREELRGTVKLIFQMGEEIGRKSEEYVTRGALKGVDAIFGMHVWPSMPIGTFNFEDGERMACSDRFTIQIHGCAAHGSAPHLGHDAILAAAAAVMALQSIPSRQNNPLDSLVVTVGMMNGGTKQNILADHVELVGTVRAFNRDFRNSMPERIRTVVQNTVQAYGCTADCDYYFGPSPLLNDAQDLVDIAQGAIKKIAGDDCLVPYEMSLGAEDFAVYTETVPGVYAYIGSANHEKGTDSPNHSPFFKVDEDVLWTGTGAYVQFAADYLNA